MNGLVLPTGSKQPLRGDASLSISPPAQLKQEGFPLRPVVKSEASSPVSPAVASFDVRATADDAHRRLPSPQSRGPANPLTTRWTAHPPSSAPSSAAAFAFIPKTARNSASVQKPIHQCSEFELEQRLDRNQRILSALEATQSPTKERLSVEAEAIRDAIRSLRAMRDVNEAISSVQLNDPSKQADLESALLGLSVKEEDYLGTSPPAEAFGWTRDTLAVKKRLAQASGAFLPGRKVQAMGFEQSLAIQSAALLAERERERRTDELRAKPMPASREKSSWGVPSGAAHRLGRKSISSCSGSMRKHSMSGSASPPKAQRAGGPFARHADTAEHEASESDTEDVGLYAAADDDDDAEEDPHPGPRHEDEGFSFGRIEEEYP